MQKINIYNINLVSSCFNFILLCIFMTRQLYIFICIYHVNSDILTMNVVLEAQQVMHWLLCKGFNEHSVSKLEAKEFLFPTNWPA